MYKYSIEKLNDWSEHEQLYIKNFPDRSEMMHEYNISNRDVRYISVREDGKLVACMGIYKLDKERDHNYSEDAYIFLHLVVDEAHTNQGIAKGMIRMCVKLLINIGAKTIHAWNRKNLIRPEIFTDLGFELIEYHDDAPLYKWYFRLDVEKVDKLKIEEICANYEESKTN